jgi:hypothetical protein
VKSVEVAQRLKISRTSVRHWRLKGGFDVPVKPRLLHTALNTMEWDYDPDSVAEFERTHTRARSTRYEPKRGAYHVDGDRV